MQRRLIHRLSSFRFSTSDVPKDGPKELYQMEKRDYQGGIKDKKVKPDNPGAKPDKIHKDVAKESVDKKIAEEKGNK